MKDIDIIRAMIARNGLHHTESPGDSGENNKPGTDITIAGGYAYLRFDADGKLQGLRSFEEA